MHPVKRSYIDKALAYAQREQRPELPFVLDICKVMCPYPVSQQCILERIATIQGYQAQLSHLKTLPKIEQRTPPWYAIRKNMITASDMAQALGDGKFASKKEFLIRKCGYKEEVPFPSFLPPLKWGTKYEPVATALYERYHFQTVHEFGLLQHPTTPFFGASPDGINDQGIMVEIKCPYKREITGEIPLQYYYQIQGQLDVCGLQECDYIECDMEEYDNEIIFWEDTDPQTTCYTKDMKDRGIVVEYRWSYEDTSRYLYSQLSIPLDQLQEWFFSTVHGLMAQPPPENAPTHSRNSLGEMEPIHMMVFPYFYRIDTFSVQRVLKNDVFFQEKMAELTEVYNKIQEYKLDKDLYLKEVEAASTRTRSSTAKTTTVAAKPTSAKTSSAKLTNSSSFALTAPVKLDGFAFMADDD